MIFSKKSSLFSKQSWLQNGIHRAWLLEAEKRSSLLFLQGAFQTKLDNKIGGIL